MISLKYLLRKETGMDCIFCAIGSGTIPAKKIAEGPSALAFLDVNPVAPGHTVVTTKKHAATLLDLTEPELGALFAVVQAAAAKIERGLGAQGFNIGVNHGKAGGQAVPHVHVHIIPRFENDGGGSMHTIVRNAPRFDLDETARRINAGGSAPAIAEEPEPPPEQKETEPPAKKKTLDEEILERAKEWEL